MSDSSHEVDVALKNEVAHALTVWRHQRGSFLVMMMQPHPWNSPGGWLDVSVRDSTRREMINRVSALLSNNDSVFELSESRLVVICHNIADALEAWRVAERFTSEAAYPSVRKDARHMMISTGAVLAAGVHATPEDVLADAQTAMKRAAEKPGTRVELFDEELRIELLSRFHSLDRIANGADGSGFHLHYQPIVAVADGSLNAVEALLRWQDTGPPRVSAQDLVLLAEQTDWIEPLGRWILEQAAVQTSMWAKAHPDMFTTFVNVSAGQLSSPRFIDDVDKILRDTGLAPERLGVEITESVLVAEEAISYLLALREMGIQISLDDFGTGFSGLRSLAKTPLDRIKLDISFVHRLADTAVRSISTSVVSLAHELGLKVTAEGVETEPQLTAVGDIGCDDVQGFFISRPKHGSALEVCLGECSGIE